MAGWPALPTSFMRPALEAAGFVGWHTWDQLQSASYQPVPPESLCYVVHRTSSLEPHFLDASPGGHFKGRSPTERISVLEAEWVANACTVYIGKATVGRRRLRAYGRFGAGEPVAHWGGRYIWQLAESADLLVAWHAISWPEPARGYEKRLLAHFAGLHDGRRPFANLAA